VEIILLERVEKLGVMGDVVNVKPGFARNYLLPQEKALRATKANLARFEAEREYLEQRNAENREKAVDAGKGVDGSKVIVIRNAGDTGQLYGSVSARHDVKVRLHPEVTVSVTVNVARTEDEAERQEKGEDVIATQLAEEAADMKEANAERAANAVSMFEGDAPEEFTAPEEGSEEEAPAAKGEEE